MANSDPPPRIHVVYGDDVNEAVPYLLERRSQRRPWRTGRRPAAEPHEPVAVVLNTEPRSIVTSLGWVGSGGKLNRVEFDDDEPLEVMPVAALAGPDYGLDGHDIELWLLEGELARALAAELNENYSLWHDRTRWGHHTLAAATILLRADGRCAGCEERRDGYWLSARTVDLDGEDYPAALCRSCRQQLQDNGFDTLVDFKIAQHPACSQCRSHRTRAIAYGMPLFDTMVPWFHYAGCCISDEHWSCTACGHSW